MKINRRNSLLLKFKKALSVIFLKYKQNRTKKTNMKINRKFEILNTVENIFLIFEKNIKKK